MSEPAPEGGGAPAAGGFMTRKFLGIPAIFWLLGAVLLAYLYFRHSSGTSSGGGATSTGGGGTSTTGDITITPSPSNLTINSQYGPNTLSSQQTTTTHSPPRHRTPNPQPKPHRKPTRKVHQKSVITGERED